MPWRGPSEEGEFPTLGYDVGEWIEAHCVIPDGYLQGQPYKLTDEMWTFLIHFYRLYPHAAAWPAPDSLRYTGGQLRRSQKWGKDPFGAAIIWAEALGPTRFDGWNADGEPVGAPYPTPLIVCLGTSEEQPLALDTPVPTPSGWSTIGKLRVGDLVFAADGNPAPVVRETQVLLGEDCYEVVFSDGERLVASGAHQWTVEDSRARGTRRRAVTLSTRELKAGCRQGRGKRYRVSATARWELPEADLPVDPYLLGLWLGDGRTADSVIAFDARHRDEYQAIIEPLLEPHERIVWSIVGVGHQATLRIRSETRKNRSFRQNLRDVGVLGDKHIPPLYLRASAKQRLSLLQGLIDSDGHIEANGRAGFTNINGRLVDDLAELLTSLGYQWRKRWDKGVSAWRLHFVPDEEPVARLAYKAARQRPRTARSTSAWRYVEAVEPVASVPVRCVGINTADHLFLVGRRAVPTHNTDNTWRPFVAMGQNGPVGNISGLDVGLTRCLLPGGGKVEPVTTSAKARLGAPLTFLTMTESHLFTLQGGFRKVAGAVKRNVAGMDGRWLELTNAWDPTEGSEAQVTGDNPDERTYVDTIEPHRVEDLGDDEALYAELLRQYGDSARERGGWVNIRGRIFGEARSSKHMEADRRRFFLNEIVVGQSVFVDPIRWDAVAAEETLRPGERIALGFDGSKKRDATSLIACRLSDGKLFNLRTWQIPDDPELALQWQVPSVEVDQVVSATFAAYDVVMMFADPYRWQDYLDVWAGKWPKQVVEFPTNVEQRMDKAIERFTTAFSAGEIANDGDAMLTQHVKNAVLVKGSKKKQRPGEETDLASHYLKMAKKGAGQLIDAAVAAVLAYAARGQAIESGALVAQEKPKPLFAWANDD